MLILDEESKLHNIKENSKQTRDGESKRQTNICIYLENMKFPFTRKGKRDLGRPRKMCEP